MILQLLNNPVNLLNYFFSNMFFSTLHNILNRRFNTKLTNNFTALTHACGCTLLAGNYLLNKKMSSYNALKIFSSGYFIYDFLLLIKHWEPKTLNYAYLYHHSASIYLMHQKPELYSSGRLFFFAELSNIPSYFVYYFQKQNPKNHNLIKKLKYLQFFMYSIIRVPIVGKILFDGYKAAKGKDGSYVPFFIGSPVFFMGLIWSKKLFDKLNID